MPYRLKVDKILEKVRRAVRNGDFRMSRHAEERMLERELNLPEVIYVLRNGYHEVSKDEFDALRLSWRYAIRGKTMDQKDVRVVVSLDNVSMMWIVTVIDKDN